ncbi:MAG: hypothetical protein ACTHJ4_06310 [Candidatus Nucleicultricaceae bacterium]
MTRNSLTRKAYVGCFAADQIPKLRSPMPQCMVVNLDTSDGVGTHWVGIYIQSPKEADYFDSFAEWPSTSEHIRHFLKQFEKINKSSKSLQSERSSACGKHVIYFLCRRCQGWPLKRIIAHIVECKTHPDKLVSAFANRFIFNSEEHEI